MENPLRKNKVKVRNDPPVDSVIQLPAELPSMVFCLEVWGSVVQRHGRRRIHKDTWTDTQTHRQT